MRKKLVKTLATISFLIAIAIVSVGPTQGQSLVYGVRVRVPFDFIVNDTTLPAGEYSISRMRNYSSDNLLMINRTDGHTVAVRMTNRVQRLDPTEQGRVVFMRYGDKYFLSQIWPAGSNSGRELIKSRSEQEAEQRARESSLTIKKKTPVREIVNINGGPK